MIMNLRYLYLGACLCTLLAAGCTDDAASVGQVEEPAAVFRLSTRAEVSDGTQLFRLYLGERKPEHAADELHCNRIVDITGGQVELTGLKPQWYKFVFLGVPRLEGVGTALFTEETPGQGSCDLNKQMIDYLPILRQEPGTKMPDREVPDGDIFRKVINRWVVSGETVSEDVQLERLNGRLVIDMGVLEDQFEGTVEDITLQVDDTPTRIYLTDNDRGEIKMADPQTLTWLTEPVANAMTDGNGQPIDPTGHHVITINLLPGALNGSIVVRTTTGTFTYPLKGSYNGDQLYIKQNTQTQLEFNGVIQGYFQVKYAGYTDTGINVDDDSWDGWQWQ